MKRAIRRITFILILCLLAAVSVCFTACGVGSGNEPAVERTISFETDGGTTIEPITAVAGSLITPPADPIKTGYTFRGWYLNAEHTGDSVSLPTVMPNKNTTYYAYFAENGTVNPTEYTIRYEYNLGAMHLGNVTDSVTAAGESVYIKNGAAYAPADYLFVGWTVSPSGVVSLSGEKNDGQYNAGESITPTGDMTLYAQWARAYVSEIEGVDDIIYVYEPLIEHGIGAAILARDGKSNKLGFVKSGENTTSGYAEFTFYFDEEDGGDVTGRLYDDTYEFAYSDGYSGVFINYDYVARDVTEYILATDGYGFATISAVVGSITVVRYCGLYEYDAEYGDFILYYLDTDTFYPILDEDGEPTCDYFSIDFNDEYKDENDNGFDGAYYMQGMESGSYLLYENGEIDAYSMLELNGYGDARLYDVVLDGRDYVKELAAEGVYFGTDMWENVLGEWKFSSGVGASFNFVLTYTIGTDDQATLLYIPYNADYAGTYTAENGDGVLELDGYGGAEYTANGMTYIGNCTFGSSLTSLTFIPYVEDEEGNTVAGGKMYFNLVPATKKFTLNTTGFVTDGTTITGYAGESQIIEIPSNITAIGDDAFNYSKDSTNENGISLVSVVIPDGVTSIGVRAFENNHTLRRAVFLSETPIAIDWSSANSPFRWPSGSFVIVVPEDYVDVYKAAWTDCPYTIKGSVEVAVLPVFEIVDGVLVRYNGTVEDGIDIIIPDGVTEIAKDVFKGLDFIRSVDLNNVIRIGEGAFEMCYGLEEVTLTNVTYIGEGAFAQCILLGSKGDISAPNVVTVGASAFASCYSLGRIVFGASLAEIGDSAFNECSVFENAPPVMIVLTGNNIPAMGGKVTTGNIAIRIAVNDVTVALKCFAAGDWVTYCRHLYIASGTEAGLYMYGDITLEIDGRAVLNATDMYLYAIDGQKITMYYFDSETATHTSYEGTIADGVITITIEGVDYVFAHVSGEKTYTSADGKYTLTVDPTALLPEKYENQRGYADATLNGNAVKIFVNGYSTKTISGYKDADGKTYNFEISLDGDTLVYTRKLADVFNMTAPDGSTLKFRYSGTLIYVSGTLKIEVESGKYLTFSDGGTIVTNQSGNVYTFSLRYLNTLYTVTVTVSADMTSFTYTYTTA